MKNLAYLFILASIFLGCQKEIDVDLNESNPKVVIEANFNANAQSVDVKASRTSNFFDNSSSPIITNATVSIIDPNGIETSIPFNGIDGYNLVGYLPQYDATYTLKVMVDGAVYLAESFLPTPVAIETPTYEYVPPGPFSGSGEDGYIIYMNINDPAVVKNFYAGVLKVNGELRSLFTQMFTQDDSVTDGNLVERPLFGDNTLFQIGDTVGIELRSIDEPMFDYINEINSILGAGQGSAAPGNPTNNWNNGALGYFSAYSSDYKEVVIQ